MLDFWFFFIINQIHFCTKFQLSNLSLTKSAKSLKFSKIFSPFLPITFNSIKKKKKWCYKHSNLGSPPTSTWIPQSLFLNVSQVCPLAAPLRKKEQVSHYRVSVPLPVLDGRIEPRALHWWQLAADWPLPVPHSTPPSNELLPSRRRRNSTRSSSLLVASCSVELSPPQAIISSAYLSHLINKMLFSQLNQQVFINLFGLGTLRLDSTTSIR